MCFLPTILVNKDDHIKCTNSLVLVLRHFAAVLAPGYTLLRGGNFAFKKGKTSLNVLSREGGSDYFQRLRSVTTKLFAFIQYLSMR